MLYFCSPKCVRAHWMCMRIRVNKRKKDIKNTRIKRIIDMKTRIIFLTLLSMATMVVSAQSFMSRDNREMTLQSQQAIQSPQTMQPVSSYGGTVYTPFGAGTPSDQSEVGSSNGEGGRPGQIRKGFITGPDTDPAQQFPIGEPWVLLLFAAGLAAWISVRRRKRIESKSR